MQKQEIVDDLSELRYFSKNAALLECKAWMSVSYIMLQETRLLLRHLSL